MVVVSASRAILACFLVAASCATALGDDPKPAAKTAEPARPPASSSREPAPALDPAQARAEVEARRKELDRVDEKDRTPAQKALRELCAERATWLDEWEKASKARQAAEHPEPTPEGDAAKFKADLERQHALQDELKKSPESLLPEDFRLDPSKLDDAKLLEMREAIERVKAMVKDRTEKYEALRLEPPERVKALTKLRNDRDRSRALTITLPARQAEREAAFASASTAEARQVARERLVNFRWEAAVEAERLAAAEATLALEARKAATLEVELQAAESGVAMSKAICSAMSKHYEGAAERLKQKLHVKAEEERSRAATSEDPLEKFASGRRAENHSLHAQVTEYEKAESATQSVSEEEQTELADAAARDFASLKQVVKENRIGGLVSLRLNNDFRRISRERATVTRNELARSGELNTYYENALTEAELSLLNDERDDQFERAAFLETLPKSRREAANSLLDDLDRKHKELLLKRKKSLEKLLSRAENTHGQVTRRLRILDEQYAFIRTNMFWVRDSEPLGAATLLLARQDAWRLLKGGARLAAEPFERGLWSPVTGEFGAGLAALMVVPCFIPLARRRLKGLLR